MNSLDVNILIENLAEIIEKLGNVFGVLALAAIIVASIAFFFFKNAEPRQKEKVFTITTFFLLGIVFCAFIVSIAQEPDPLFVNNSTLGGHVTVDATAGLQNSGIYLEENQKVILEPEGRVHLASDQINNLAELVRYFIVQNMDDEEVPKEDKQRYGAPPFKQLLNKNKVFRRNWSGPDGEPIESPFRLDQCKLRNDLNWGMLLTVVLPAKKSDKTDPFLAAKDPIRVLKEEYGLKISDLQPVTRLNKSTLTARRSGWLTFIINDAVMSKLSEADVSVAYYNALIDASGDLAADEDDLYRIPQESVPLVWYSDNVGAFRVTVKPG